MKKQIPNIVTLSNLMCGCLSIYAATVWKDLNLAGLFILLGAVFDFFDGMVARLLHVQSEIGKELDSLADVVTFGVAPGFIAHFLLKEMSNFPEWVTFIPFIMALLSAYRLAKFNLDTRQTSSFIGLPTPANAMIWASLPFIFTFKIEWILPTCVFDTIIHFFENQYVLLILSIVLAVLLVAELPLFSLKFKNLKWVDNKIRFVFLAISLVLILLLNFTAIPLIILVFIILSFIEQYLLKAEAN